jgi:hypothetical protein
LCGVRQHATMQNMLAPQDLVAASQQLSLPISHAN